RCQLPNSTAPHLDSTETCRRHQRQWSARSGSLIWRSVSPNNGRSLNRAFAENAPEVEVLSRVRRASRSEVPGVWHALPAGAKFCNECGKPVGTTPTTSSPPGTVFGTVSQTHLGYRCTTIGQYRNLSVPAMVRRRCGHNRASKL